MATQPYPAYQQRYIDPNNPFADPAFDPNAPGNAQGAAPDPSANPIYGAPGGALPTPNPDPEAPIHNMFYDDQGRLIAGANQINAEAQSQLGYYGPRQAAYGAATDTALANLNATPGFNQDEASKIGIDYGQYRTSADDMNKQFLTGDEQSAIKGDPNDPRNVMNAGTAAEGAMLNQYQANQGAQVGQLASNVGGQMNQYQSNVGDQMGKYESGVGTGVSNLDTMLQGSQDKFGKLDTAVGNPGLAFDPNATEKQMTDADVQAIKTAAGERIGNQYRSAEDTLNRQAAAAGNTSPLAIEAARARLENQSAAGQGSAEYQADIAARQAQYDRAAGIEGQREGAVKTQVGFQAGAATQEQAQAQAAAGLAGTSGIAAAENVGQADLSAAENVGAAGVSAAENVGQAGINAANTYGQFSTQTASNMANQGYGAAQTAEQEAAARAAMLGANRQNTQANVNNATYTQGMNTGQATSAGQQTLGGARMQGQAAYRSGLAQQEGMAQQGGQNAMQQQGQTLQTTTSGLNQSTANRANYENTGPGGLGKAGSQIFGAGMKLLGADEGGVFTEPTLAIVGEKRPEMVVKVPQRYGYRSDNGKAA